MFANMVIPIIIKHIYRNIGIIVACRFVKYFPKETDTSGIRLYSSGSKLFNFW